MSEGSLILNRDELVALTGTKQPKRMLAWLVSRGWVHEAPARRGDIPKVGRAYAEARLSGRPLPGTEPPKRRVEPSADWMLQRVKAPR